MHTIIHEFSLVKIDYISIANPKTLAELDLIKNRLLISLAVTIEDTRLIDNMMIEL